MDAKTFAALQVGTEVDVVTHGGHALKIGTRATVVDTPNESDVLVRGTSLTGNSVEQFMLPSEIELAAPLFEVISETTVTVTGYHCTKCGMVAETDDLAVIGRNCSATDFEEAHDMVPILREEDVAVTAEPTTTVTITETERRVLAIVREWDREEFELAFGFKRPEA